MGLGVGAIARGPSRLASSHVGVARGRADLVATRTPLPYAVAVPRSATRAAPADAKAVAGGATGAASWGAAALGAARVGRPALHAVPVGAGAARACVGATGGAAGGAGTWRQQGDAPARGTGDGVTAAGLVWVGRVSAAGGGPRLRLTATVDPRVAKTPPRASVGTPRGRRAEWRRAGPPLLGEEADATSAVTLPAADLAPLSSARRPVDATAPTATGGAHVAPIHADAPAHALPLGRPLLVARPLAGARLGTD